MPDIQCIYCNKVHDSTNKFCPHCGKATDHSIVHKAAADSPKTKVKVKKSKSGIILKSVVFLIIIAFILWYNIDPDAEENLGDVIFSAVFMLVFGFFIWLKRPKGSLEEMKKEQEKQKEQKLLREMDEPLENYDDQESNVNSDDSDD